MDSAIWTEKYRPNDFSEVKGQKEIVNRAKAFVKQGNMPHLLFAGPAGVGKTTLALVIAKQFFGENWRQNFLELNASDERGIDVVRNKVKDFARTKSMGDVPYRIIYLDECDALTREAQQALRRTMENYTNTCRFILSCVTPDTKILLSDDREITIKEFIDQFENNIKDKRVQNISKERTVSKEDLVLAAVTLPASSVGKKVIEITTMSGRKIKVTDDHKLLTTDGWKEAGKLTEKDKLLVYPHLEDTPSENNPNKIIDLAKFVEFLSYTEERDGLKRMNNASRFRELKSTEKEKILARINELKCLLKLGDGLTEREFEAYSVIKEKREITRKELQEKLGLTRMGINYLLPSLEKKGCIKRIRTKKTHSFIVCNSEPMILRNDAHIQKIIKKEFNQDISYQAVRQSQDLINRGRIDRVIGELKRKELLDITYNNVGKAGVLARLCGFILGDGHLVRNSIRLHFTGNKEALKAVQKDLDTLGYSNYSRIKSVELRNTIRGRMFVGKTTSFTLDSRPLSLLLQYMGIPKGDKSVTLYNVPEFVKCGTKFVKREFIRALFGCDADKPKYKKMNYEALSLRQNKAESLKENMLQYYREISKLFLDFGITSYTYIRDKGEIRTKDNAAVLTFHLTVTPNNANLQKYFSRVGYAYEDYKIKLARLSAEYLRHKLFLIESWKKKSQLAIALIDSGSGIRETARKLDVTPDFVSNQIKGKEVNLPRNHFMHVDEWIKRYRFNDLLFINEINEIKEIDEDIVMDITCHKDHNFVSNGFISHNCNYSSKIIDPIQSRCVVFRFRPLEKEEVFFIINNVAAKEGLNVDEKAKEALYQVSEGDCRRVENLMQSCAALSKNITEDDVFSISSFARPQELKQAMELALENKFIESRNKLLEVMLNYGLSGLDVIKQIQKEVWELNIDNRKKVALIDKCGEIEFRMVEGADEFVQLEALLSQFVLAGMK